MESWWDELDTEILTVLAADGQIRTVDLANKPA
jgi:hypothetical protein